MQAVNLQFSLSKTQLRITCENEVSYGPLRSNVPNVETIATDTFPSVLILTTDGDYVSAHSSSVCLI
jgi:hypothetical protein